NAMVLLSPFPSLVPSFVIETVVTRLRGTAAIPIRRLPKRRRLGPPRDRGEKSMNRKSSKKQKRAGPGGAVPSLHGIESNAAGIDVGATEIFVAVPQDRDASAVRSFETFTQDLHRLKEWLQQCRITTVAMESRGVYWIPL